MTGIILGTLAIVAITIALGLLLNRKVSLLPGPEDFDTDQERERKQRVTHGAGEAPSTALRLRRNQLDRIRTSQRCASCNAAMANDTDDEVRYGETSLLVLQFSCPRCTSRRSLYIDPVTSQ